MKKMFSLMIGGFLGFSIFALGLVGPVNAQWGDSDVWWFGSQTTKYNPDVPWSSALKNDDLITSIKGAINRILGLLALIALIVLLWWGFQMVTAAWDDAKYKKWFKILQQAGMWLLFIWFSWLFVSVIFRLVNKFVWA